MLWGVGGCEAFWCSSPTPFARAHYLQLQALETENLRTLMAWEDGSAGVAVVLAALEDVSAELGGVKQWLDTHNE